MTSTVPAALEPSRPGRVVVIASQKGGVGKTTCTLNLAAALTEAGKKVLALDLDPQAHLTLGLGVDPAEIPLSLAHVLGPDNLGLSEVICTTKSGIDLAPATIDLAMTELDMANALGRDQVLVEAITETLRRRYDYVLLDTPPTLGLLTINALVAARWVIIPVQAHFYALKGMAHLLRLVRQVQGRLNKELEILGILTTFYDARTQLSRQVLETLREEYESLVLDTVIKATVRLAEAPISGESVLAMATQSEAAQAYRQLAGEVLRRAEA
jgi:chromosome partitioning protein